MNLHDYEQMDAPKIKVWNIFFSTLIFLAIIYFARFIFLNEDLANFYITFIPSIVALALPRFFSKNKYFYSFFLYFLTVRIIDFYLVYFHGRDIFNVERYVGPLLFLMLSFFFFNKKYALKISILNVIMYLLPRYYVLNYSIYPNPNPDIFTTKSLFIILLLIIGISIVYYFYRVSIEANEEKYISRLKGAINLNKSLLHDLNNHLTKLSGMTHMISNKDTLTQDDINRLQLVSWEMNNFTKITKELLNEENFNQHLQSISFQEITDRIKILFTDQLASKNLQIDFQGDKDFTISTLPSILLISIIGNLLSNSIKFSKNGSKIVIKFTKVGHHKKILIEDSAGGITEENLELLYERSNRLQSSLGTQGEEGSGFGLKIVHYYCDIINAKLSLHNSSEGTQFQISF